MRHNLPVFEHIDAQSIEQACEVLSQRKAEASVLAGGTDLLVRMKYRASTPNVLVNLKTISNFNQIEEHSDGGLAIGAFTRLRDIEGSQIVRDKFPVFHQAACSVANRTIRNMGSLGGNLCQDPRCEYYTHSHSMGIELWPKCFMRGGDLCHIMKNGDRCYARYSSDTAPALMALGAQLKIVGVEGEKTIALEDFFTGKGHPANVLQPGEILTEIHIPNLYASWEGVYIKFAFRGTTDYPIVGVAAVASLEGDICKDVRLFAVSVDSSPVRLKQVESTIKGIRLDDSSIAKAAEIATKSVKPVVHHGNSPKYIREMTGSCTKKALNQFLKKE